MAVIKIKYAANKVASLSLPKFSGGTAGDMIVAGELAFGGSSPTTAGVLVIGTGSQDANAIIGGSAFFDQTIANYIGGTAYGKTGTGSNVLATGPTLSGAVSITGASASLTVGTVSVYAATTLYGNLTVGGTTVTLTDTTTIKGTGTTGSTAVLTIQPGNAANAGTLAVSGNLSVSSTIVTLADTTTIKGTSGTGVLNIWPGNAVNAGTLAVSGNLSVSGNLTGGLKVLSSTLPQVTLSNTASEYLTIGVNTTGGATFTTVSATAESARPPFKFVGAGLNSPYLDTYFVRGIADNTLTPATTEYTLAISAGDITLGASASGSYTGALTAAGLISAGSFSTTGAINAGSINVSEVQTAKLYIGTTQVNLNQASGTVEYLNGMLGIGVEQLKGAPTLENEINATAASNRIANKGYVDSVAAGLHIHAPADLILLSSLAGAITNESTITYYNGISSNGVGATLTISAAASTSLIFSIDGVAVVATNRIIIAGETDESQKIWHGIYTVTAFTGAASASIVLTRASDADTISDLSGGDFIFVTSGTVYADSGFVQTTNPGTFTLGTTFKPVFVQFSSAGDIIAGAGLSKSGGAISVELTTNGGLAITGNSITGTLGINTSIAGSGLSLTNGVLSVNSVALSSGVSGTLPVSNGGTGSGTALTAWSVLYASSATAAVSTNAGAANTVLTGQASAAPSFSSTPTLGRLTLTEVAAAAGTTALTVSPANHTAVTAETPAFSVAANILTITTGFPTSGATSVQRFNRFTAPTIAGAATGLTVVTAATVAITGAPSSGTNTPTLSASYALLVESGEVLFKGLIKAGSGATPTALTDTAGKILTAALNTVGVAQGGTGVGTFAANGVLYGNSASAISVTAAGAANTVLTGQGSGAAPSFSSTPTLGRLTLTEVAATAGTALTVSPANHTAVTTDSPAFSVASNAIGTTGIAAAQRFSRFTAGTFTGNGTVATAATVAISGAPTATGATITNSYALWVESGNSRFNGEAMFNYAKGISFKDSDDTPISAYVIRPNEATDIDTHVSTILLPRCTSTKVSVTSVGSGTGNSIILTGATAATVFPIGSVITGAGISVTGSVVTTSVGTGSGTATVGLSQIITYTASAYIITYAIDTLALLGTTGQTFTGGPSFTTNCPTSTVTPILDAHIANKLYVDSVAQGLHVHPPADVILLPIVVDADIGAAAYTGTLATAVTGGTGVSIIYGLGLGVNGYVTGTIAITSTGGTLALTIDGVLIANWTRIVIAGEGANGIRNGIYEKTQATPTLITLGRALDANVIADISGGDFVFIKSGTLYANCGFVQTAVAGALTLDGNFTPLFSQFSYAGVVTAGGGLTKTGTKFAVGAGTGISVADDAISISLTAGTGITVSGATITFDTNFAVTTLGNVTTGTIDGGTF